MRIVLAVSGGIAAYKAVSLLREFSEQRHDVTVVLTRSALKFVGRATWEALSGNKVYTKIFENIDQVNHIALAKLADVIVIAPATANIIAKIRYGISDDLITNILLATKSPIVIAPAMHTEMWEHPTVVANIAELRKREINIIEPEVGRLTGEDSGVGRLASIEKIFTETINVANLSKNIYCTKDLVGHNVLITGGGTREPIDSARFIGNYSSGKQAVALASEALKRGAKVTMLCANIEVSIPQGVETVLATTALEMEQKILSLLDTEKFSVIVMAAAVSDYRMEKMFDSKIKKTDSPNLQLSLVANPDILSNLIARRNKLGGNEIVVGFAAETSNENNPAIELAQQKMLQKKCDFLIFNDITGRNIFGKDDTNIRIISSLGDTSENISGTKTEVSQKIWNQISLKLA